MTADKRAMALYAAPLDWPSLLALRPVALLAMDPYHLPLRPTSRLYFLWRPWVGLRLNQVTPQQWYEAARREWALKGFRYFNGILPLNEPNVHEESGLPTGSREAAEVVNAWYAGLVPLLRNEWPDVEIHTPP